MKTLTACILLLMVGFVCRPMAASLYVIDAAAGGDSVHFRSTASLEFIEGKTGNLSGWIDWDQDIPDGPVSGVLQVDLRTLKTGIETRDEHMRDRHLHTDEYPFAWFELTGLSDLPPLITPDSTYHAAAHGFFYIHGVRRQIEAQISFVVEREGPALAVSVTFALQLDDYEINRPRALFMKLAETIEIEVVMTARPGRERPAVTLPEWPELK